MTDAARLAAPLLLRADGVKPRNDHFYPTESWWLWHEHQRFSGRWHFGIIALADGRFACGKDGSIWSIAENKDYHDLPCVYPTRDRALRTDAARLIRALRWSRDWQCSWDTVKGKDLEFAINWVLDKVAAATQRKRGRRVCIPEPAAPPTGWRKKMLEAQTLIES